MANIIDGGDLMLFVKNGASAKSIAFATSHRIAINAESSDITHKDIKGGWKASKVKSFSWEVSTENLFSNDGEGVTFYDLFDLMTAKTEINAVFAVNDSSASVVPTGGWSVPSSGEILSGKVIITSLEANAPSGDNATFTCTFVGVGALEHEI